MITSIVLILCSILSAAAAAFFFVAAKAQIESKTFLGVAPSADVSQILSQITSTRMRFPRFRRQLFCRQLFRLLSSLAKPWRYFFSLSITAGVALSTVVLDEYRTLPLMVVPLVHILIEVAYYRHLRRSRRLFITRFMRSHGEHMLLASPALSCGVYFGAGPVMRHEYRLTGKLPKRVHFGDSRALSFQMASREASLLAQVYSSDALRSGDVSKDIAVTLETTQGQQAFVEMEILPSGVQVAGSTVQRAELTGEPLNFIWNCFFNNSGSHIISFVIRMVQESKSTPVGQIDHSVRVVRVDHLTQRQVWLLGALFTFITGVIAAIGIIHSIGQKTV